MPTALRPTSEADIQSQVNNYLKSLLSGAQEQYGSMLGAADTGLYTQAHAGSAIQPILNQIGAPGMPADFGSLLDASGQPTVDSGSIDKAVQWLQGQVSQAPELALKMAADLHKTERDKAKAAIGILQGNQKYYLDWLKTQNTVLSGKETRTLNQQKFGLNVAKAQETAAYHQQLTKNANRSFAYQQRAHKDTLAQADADRRQPSATLSKLYGHMVDQDGNPILDTKTGGSIPVKPSTSSRSPYQQAVSTAVGLAKEGAQTKTVPANRFQGYPTMIKQQAATYEETVKRIVAAITPSMQEAGYGTAVIWGIAQKQANAWYGKRPRKPRTKSKTKPSGYSRPPIF